MMTTRYCLSGHLDSAAAPAMASDLLERRGQALCIDAGAATHIGTLPLQVLIAAHRQWNEDGQVLQIAPIGPVLQEAAKGLGVPLSAFGAEPTDREVVEAEA